MLSKLGDKAKRALACHILSGLALAVADTFVNVYIFRLGKGYQQVACFQIWRSLLAPVGFALSAWLARRTSTSWAFRAGILTYNLFYLLVLVLGERCMTMLPLLGSLLGLSMGMYWLGWQVLILDLTHDGHRDKFFSLNNVGGGLASMVGGPLAGWFLSSMPGVAGYRWVFGFASLIFLTAAAVSLPLHTPPLFKASGLRRLWNVSRNPAWRRTLFTSLLGGVRDGALMFIMGVLVYEASGSEAGLGRYTALVSVLALAGGSLAGRYTRPATRERSLRLGAFCITLGIVILAFRVNQITLLITGCLTALMAPFFNVPYASALFRVLNDSPRLMRRRADSLVLREIPVSIGRIVGSALILMVTGANTPILKAIFLLLGVIPLVIYVTIRPLLREESTGTPQPARTLSDAVA